MRHNNLEDPSNLSGVYEGDLRYGRYLSDTGKNDKDYSAERDERGIPRNKAVVKLVLQEQRDPQVWKKEKAIPKKSEVVRGDDIYGEILLERNCRPDSRSRSLGENISRVTRFKG